MLFKVCKFVVRTFKSTKLKFFEKEYTLSEI